MSASPKIKPTDVEAYEYMLPDHWIRDEWSYWQIIHDSYVRYVIETLVQAECKRVVEVGCGDGWNCGQALAAGLEVVGFDWSKNGIEHAKRMVPEGIFERADIRDSEVLAKYRHSFEGAMFIEVIEHIPPEDAVAAVRSIGELLKDNGVLVMTTPSVNLPNNNPQHFRHFDKETLVQIVEDAGFTVEQTIGYGNMKSNRLFWKLSRFIDNRLWLIKPIKRMLLNKFAPTDAGTDLAVCEGMILIARKTKE